MRKLLYTSTFINALNNQTVAKPKVILCQNFTHFISFHAPHEIILWDKMILHITSRFCLEQNSLH